MTLSMHFMTEKMHDIAVKTGRQTVSMHAITVFTLVFLPGTFLAVRRPLSSHTVVADLSDIL